VYSLRARAHPTVSTPVSWDEVETCLDKGDPSYLVFETDDVLRRAEERDDLFAPTLTLKQKLPRSV
jgi:bifunctional non-homologous end joining protein LigD